MKKRTKKDLLKYGMIIAALMAAVSVSGCNKDKTPPEPAEKAEPTKETEPTKEDAEPAKADAGDKVSTALQGKLIGLKDGGIAEAELTGSPEYYVLYHSASW